jgi:PAS domain S-box-containing protein
MTKRKKARRGGGLQRLRRRLREAEDTLNAIRDGHVEALVVRSGDGDSLYTLRSADHPYRLMVEQMREGAVTVGADGTILYCNGRFAELVGSPAERVTTQPFGVFLDAGDAGTLEALIASETFRGDVLLRAASGIAIPAQLSSSALTIDGIRTVAVVVTDLTHERTERALRESNRLKDEFLATLSHELRTPLNVILGWTRMLLAGHLSDSARDHALRLIDRNAQAQAQLVNDLVDMSRVTTGKLRLELEPVALVPALEAALESVRPAADARRLEFETAWGDRDLVVLADPTRLQQVVWNLLSNAVKFTPDGGRISMSAVAEPGRVRLEVADTGIGIDPAFLPHVFDRFRQAESGTTRAYGGLGLGLAIVHDLVRLHGGTVEVRSDGHGKGATFVVSLRASGEPVRRRERREPSRTRASLAGCRIVLVEDHGDSREMLVQALQDSGAAVVAFASAGEALPALEAVGPSVIVADIGLPGEDGYAFVRKVRVHPSRAIRSVPAIAVTAYGTPADRAEALSVGFQEHLAKPVDPRLLVDAIHDVTRARKIAERSPR